MVIARCIVVVGVASLAAWWTASPPAPVSAGPAPALQTAPAAPTFVGTKKCRMCHTAHHDAVAMLPKAGAWDALAPHEAAAVKQRAGLSTTTDYRTHGDCLACHSVGFGQPGGYAVPAADDRRAARRAKHLQGVGCESCHGPGSEYVKVMRDVQKNKRSYEASEMAAAGRRPVTAAKCQTCHRSGAPCMVNAPNDAWLEVDLDDHRGYHEAVPLKFRRGAPRAPERPAAE